MPEDYGYINARLRGMHGRLLTDRLPEALAAGSYAEFLRMLSESDLGADLGEATAQDAGLAELDRAVSRNLYSTTQKILGFADGAPGRDIGLLLARYDLQNLKTIARGKSSGREAAEIEANLLPAGTIKPGVLATLAAAPDLTAVASALGVTGHPLARAFRAAAAGFTTDRDLLALEVRLDRAYFDEALERADSEVLRGFLRREIDGANLLTALKLRAQGTAADIDRYFVPGGREFGRDRFARAAAGEGGLDGLGLFANAAGASSLGEAESAVRQALLGEARRLYASDALGIGIMIGFLREKENEVALVRLIARGKLYGVPAETLRREVGGSGS